MAKFYCPACTVHRESCGLHVTCTGKAGPLRFEDQPLRETLGWTPSTWALRRLFLGPAEQPLQPEEPLLEELVAHVSHRQRGRRSQGGLQADAYSGYNELYDPARPQGPITAAFCWAHARRQFFELADIAANARRGKKATAIIALEAVKRIDALFDIERGISGQSAEERQRVRLEQSAPLLAALEAWLREQRSRLSRSSSVAEPIDYIG